LNKIWGQSEYFSDDSGLFYFALFSIDGGKSIEDHFNEF